MTWRNLHLALGREYRLPSKHRAPFMAYSAHILYFSAVIIGIDT